MKVFEGAHYYNEKGEMGLLISVSNSFASDNLEMATDKRVIDVFLNFCWKNENGYLVLKDPNNDDLIDMIMRSFGYYEDFEYYNMEFKLVFIPIGKKFTVEPDELRAEYGEFEGYYDQIIFEEDFKWNEAI